MYETKVLTMIFWVCVCELMSNSKVCMMRFTVVWATAEAKAAAEAANIAKAIAHEMNIKNDTYGTAETFICVYTHKKEEIEEEQSRRGKKKNKRRRRRGSNRSRNCVMFCLFAVVMREIHVFMYACMCF